MVVGVSTITTTMEELGVEDGCACFGRGWVVKVY